MPPAILYVCGGLAITVIAAYAIFDMSRPYHERQLAKEEKRRNKMKTKNRKFTDAVIAEATKKDEETKAFLEKRREELKFFNPPEDQAEPASNETNLPIEADPEAKPNAEENIPENEPASTEELPSDDQSILDMPTEEITRQVQEAIRTAPANPEVPETYIDEETVTPIDESLTEISEEIYEETPIEIPEEILQQNDEPIEPVITEPLIVSEDIAGTDIQQDPAPKQKKKHKFSLFHRKDAEPCQPPVKEKSKEPDLDEEEIQRLIDEINPNTNNTKSEEISASPATAESAPEPTGVSSEAEETNEVPNKENETSQEYDFTEAQPNPYANPDIPMQDDQLEMNPEQKNPIPNDEKPLNQDFNGRILHLRKTDQGLEYHPEDEHQIPENAWTGYEDIPDTDGKVYDFEPGNNEPTKDNIIQMPVNWREDDQEELPDNITPLRPELANTETDGWNDYPDTEIIPETTTEKGTSDLDLPDSQNLNDELPPEE